MCSWAEKEITDKEVCLELWQLTVNLLEEDKREESDVSDLVKRLKGIKENVSDDEKEVIDLAIAELRKMHNPEIADGYWNISKDWEVVGSMHEAAQDSDGTWAELQPYVQLERIWVKYNYLEEGCTNLLIRKTPPVCPDPKP